VSQSGFLLGVIADLCKSDGLEFGGATEGNGQEWLKKAEDWQEKTGSFTCSILFPLPDGASASDARPPGASSSSASSQPCCTAPS
jgi:hypothetical protein